MELIDSELNRDFVVEGHRFQVEIYRSPSSGWILEVVDETNASTVWSEEFETDRAALKEFERFIAKEGARGILETGDQGAT